MPQLNHLPKGFPSELPTSQYQTMSFTLRRYQEVKMFVLLYICLTYVTETKYSIQIQFIKKPRCRYLNLEPRYKLKLKV